MYITLPMLSDISEMHPYVQLNKCKKLLIEWVYTMCKFLLNLP